VGGRGGLDGLLFRGWLSVEVMGTFGSGCGDVLWGYELRIGEEMVMDNARLTFLCSASASFIYQFACVSAFLKDTIIISLLTSPAIPILPTVFQQFTS
jgi:hypothetical protein